MNYVIIIPLNHLTCTISVQFLVLSNRN